jgi:hypothetical protein
MEQVIPLYKTNVLLAMQLCVAEYFLRQPSCSGGTAVNFAPCLRCDMRPADLQVGRTLRGIE